MELTSSFQLLILTQSEFADIREIVALPNYRFWIVGALIVMLLIGVFCWKLFRKDLRVSVPEIGESASEKAYRLLGKLKEQQEDFDSETFAIEVSKILRLYLEEELQLPAMEQTTEEFLRDLPKADWLTSELRKNLEEFARVADLVKFARQSLRVDQREELLSSAFLVVETTQLQPETLAIS